MLEHERSRWRELVYEIVLTDIKADRLPADGRTGFKVIDYFQPVFRPRQRRQCRVAVAYLDRLFDDQWLLFRGLLDDAGLLDPLDEREARPIAAGHFANAPAAQAHRGI